MQFAVPLPWWVVLLVAAAIGTLAYVAYRRPPVPLSAGRRSVLMVLRGLALAAIVLFLCRPTVLAPPVEATGVVVPILVDVSRSMRIADVDGRTRLDHAVELVSDTLLPDLSPAFVPEVYAVGSALTLASVDDLRADERRTDLAAAIRAIRAKYRGRPVSGVVLVSDGGDTSLNGELVDEEGPPVFTVGIGSVDGVPDREIVGMVAGDPRLDQAAVDLRVSAVGRGYGRRPFDIDLFADGRLIESRTVVPVADGAPVDEVFTVFPDSLNPTVFMAQITAEAPDVVSENDSRSVLISPPDRPRRVLALQGAPGYDHSFVARALAKDPGLEVDLVVRKGRNDEGDDTFLVQARRGRESTLTSGFPDSREALYTYDAVMVANVEGDFLARAQLAQLAEFVSERGGGLLVFGARSLSERGLIGTALEEALPLELNERGGGVTRAAYESTETVGRNAVSLTLDGETHPVMRLDVSPIENRRRWSAMPTLAGSALLGGPRPGATVLAVTAAPNGTVYPLVAVQRYGRGRSLVFTGEASWRWRMLLPSTDRSFEYFWRQALRWLASAAPEPVTMRGPETSEPGEVLTLGVDVHDAGFVPVSTATVEADVTTPGGGGQSITFRRESSIPGRFVGDFRPQEPGIYRVRAEARDGGAVLGASEHWFHVGGSDREFADPRLNEGVLSRVARATGGRYVRSDEIDDVVSWLQAAVPPDAPLERRDLWHDPWAIAMVIMLLSAEWGLRRRWGLR